LLGLLLAEGLVRMAGLRPLPMPVTQGSLFADVEHPLLRYVNRPGAEQVIHYDDGPGRRWSVTMRTNAQRFRGPEVDPHKPEGVVRVACLGDSHTWGEGVEVHETWPAQLQALARPGVEVLNCGVNGYDTLQEALWYERFVEPFDPDVVLVGYFANDVAARGLEEEGARLRDDWLTTWTHPRRPGAMRFLREHSVVVDLTCDRLFRWRSLQARQDSWDSRYSEDDPGWKRAREALLRLRGRCAQQGRELRVVLLPYLVPEGGVFESHAALEIVAQYCAVNDIPCFDGEPALLAALGAGELADLRVSLSDFHANARAYSSLARALAPWLAATGLPFGPD
jgi:lysophospholipase L1-like esterase